MVVLTSGTSPPALPPVRTCVICRRAASRSELIRLTVSGGAVTVDARGRMPGRGAYLCDRPECLEAALARGGNRLARALRFDRHAVTVDREELRREWKAAARERRRRGVCT